MKRRLIVVAVIRRDDGKVLLCRMPPNRGVFPGQWGLPGGGVEDGERIEDALRREIREELGMTIGSATPAYFKAESRLKRYHDGTSEDFYMVFLIYTCSVDEADPILNQEFDAAEWIAPGEMGGIDLNEATRATLQQVGLTTAPSADSVAGNAKKLQG